MQSAQTALPAYLLESSPVAPGLHAELTSILEAHPEVAKQLSRTASAGAPLLRKLPISEFLVAAYGEPAVNTGTYVNADGITRTEFTAGAVPIVKLLDVRSPGEFARGHLPGAVNIPLFEDHERAEVGTLFAEKGQEYATSHGLALVGPKLRMYVEFARKAEEESSQVLVYCWRGGQRSASVGWLLSRCGSCASVNTLSGGYRAFRRWAIELVGEDSAPALAMRREKAHRALQPGDLFSASSTSTSSSAPATSGPAADEGGVAAKKKSKQDKEKDLGSSEGSGGATPPATEQQKKRKSVDAFNAGLRCFKAKEWGAAAAHFTVAISLEHPRLGGCYNLRGESRAQLGDLVGAFQDLDRSVELMPRPGERGREAPGNIATFVNRSNCYKKVGRYAAACADLRLALQIDPKHKQAKKSLAELELAMAHTEGVAASEHANAAGNSAGGATAAGDSADSGDKCGYSNALDDIADSVATSSVSAEHAKRRSHTVQHLQHGSGAGGSGSGGMRRSASSDSTGSGPFSPSTPRNSAGNHESESGFAEEEEEADSGGEDKKYALVAVLGGRTGSGKTEILHRLRDAGQAVVDLEGLACHRGSAFGAIGQEPQPTNEMYENRCALAWWTQSARALHCHDCFVDGVRKYSGRVWMEHEGPHVGKCKVPTGLLAQLNKAAGGFVVVEMDRALRVERLVQDYCSSDPSDGGGGGGSGGGGLCGLGGGGGGYGQATMAAAVVASAAAAVTTTTTFPAPMAMMNGVGRFGRGAAFASLSFGAFALHRACVKVDCDPLGSQRHRSRQIDEELRGCIENLRRKLGETRHEQALGWLAVRDYTSLADLMLDYYDGLYDQHRETNTSELRARVRCGTIDASINANIVLRANNTREEMPLSKGEVDLTPTQPDQCNSPIKSLDKWPIKHVES